MAIDLRDYGRTALHRGWGAGWPSCAGASGQLALVTARRSGTRITVHKRIARLAAVLLDWTEDPHGGAYALKPGQCGGYNCRPIAGTQTSSNHAWGLAIDLNWADNPYTATGRHTIPWPVIRRWNHYGWASGADYEGVLKDWMHLEFMGGAIDADAMTALALRELTGAAPPAARRTVTEDQTMHVTTPPASGADKRAWPAQRISFGFDPAGGWGGKCVLNLHFGFPGGWVHEAKWWVRGGTGVGDANAPHSPVAVNYRATGGQERHGGMGWQLEPPARADELEILCSAPGGVHIFPVYQH